MSIVQRIATLNRSKVLPKPLRYSEVKDALTQLGTDAALQLLQDVEDQAAYITDPVEHILNASQEIAAAGQPAEPGADNDSASGRGDGKKRDRAHLEDDGGYEPPSLKRVKVEADPEPAAWRPGAVKSEPSRTPYWSVKAEHGGVKGEELTDAEKIARRVAWINDKANLRQPLELEEVAEALDCIGLRQAMRVLRRLEENAEVVDDPADFVIDLVARTGWIWSRPDIIDDDVKVAKCVTWLNLFAGLRKPIDYSQVADLLDGLKVAHAMVLLKELEAQAWKIKDPTAHIKRTVKAIGTDDIEVPPEIDASAWQQVKPELDRASYMVKAELPAERRAPLAPRQPPPRQAPQARTDKKQLLPAEDAYGAAMDEEEDAGEEAPDAEDEYNSKLIRVSKEEKEVYEDELEAEDWLGARAPTTGAGGAEARMDRSEDEQRPALTAPWTWQPAGPGPMDLRTSHREKLIEMREIAMNAGLHLDDGALKNMTRLTTRQAQDLVQEVVLGGRDRTQIRNPSRYVSLAVDRKGIRLGAEQGIAMELAAQYGVVLNNEALDELASIPRREAHDIIRGMAKLPQADDPMNFLRSEVSKVRMLLDARPFGAR